jgi:selenocysteine lyase/cysteine desulfurase
MAPAEVGGGMVDDVYLDKFIASANLPDREEAGTPNIVGAITLGAVLEVLMKIGMDNIRLKEIKLIDLAWEKLSAIEGVNLYGPAPSVVPRTGTIPFNIQGFDHGLTAAALNDYYNIQIRNGCFCAHPYVREILKPELWALDIDPDAPNSEADVERKRGMARASFGIYTTEADVLALAEAISDLVSRKQEILSLYEPEGSNGYRHTKFSPHNDAIFCAERSLEQALSNYSD